VQAAGADYEVQVSFKDISTVRLRVVPEGEVRLSAPRGTDRQWLEQFLADHGGWIASGVEKMRQRPKREKPAPLTDAEREAAFQYLKPMVDKFYPVVAAYGVVYPRITVRAMSSRYGSCSVNSGRITLNSVLTRVPVPCAEYVVLHELAHFLYPNHGKGFYGFIARYMPDWQERRRLLTV